MDVSELTELILDKFKECGGYMELEEKDLKKTIESHLTRFYKFEIECAIMQLEHNKISGKKVSKKDYSKAFEDVETKLITEAELLAVSSKEELEYFV